MRALDDVDLRVETGDFLAIRGPSGCGKSTLLSVLGLLEPADDGEYLLVGRKASELGFSDRCRVRNRHIGLVFQAFNLLADLTVEENVGLPLRYGEIPPAEHHDRVRALLDRVGMLDRAQHYPHQLSGGQQQRVAVARAMVTGPSLILADEPTGNLDSHHAAGVVSLLREFHQEGATVVIVTHDPGVASAAQQQRHMRDGRWQDPDVVSDRR